MDEMVTIEDKINAVAKADSEDPSDMAEKLEDFNDHLEDLWATSLRAMTVSCWALILDTSSFFAAAL